MRSTFVGRVRERTELGRLITAAREGSGALALIGGEAGVGKTALVTWTLEEAGPVRTAVSRCTGPGEAPLYGPWRDLAAQVGDLAWPGAPVQGYDLAAALAQGLRSDGQPLILAVEDIQWADGASLELLRHLALHVGRLPLLLLVTYRSTEAEPLRHLLPELQRAGAVRLQLGRFTPDEVVELAAAALPDHPGAALMARYVHQRTGGHPLFVTELLATARAGGAPDGPVPETVQQAIDQQVDRLEPAALPVLQAAAVIGERFDYDLLAQVADGPEEEILAALEAAVALRLVHAEGPAGDRFAFDHALVREVLLGRLIGPRRRRWHQRVAEALLAGTGPGLPAATEPERVALHLERAGDPRAVDYLLLAGDRGLRLGARAQAAQRYEQALALLAAPGQLGGTMRDRRAETLLRLAHATEGPVARAHAAGALQVATTTADAAVATWARHLQATWHAESGHPGALAELEAAQQQQEALLDDERYQRLEAVLYGESLAYPRVCGALALALAKAGRTGEAQALVTQMQARTRPGDRRTPILRVQWWMASLMGRWSDALELGQRLSEALQAEGDQRAAFRVESNRLYHALLCKADEPAAVDAVAAEMLRLAERVTAVSGCNPLAAGHPPLGWYSYLRGDWVSARHHLLGYLQRHPEDADPGVRGFAVLLQLALGDTAGARATLMAVPPLHPDEEPGLHTVQVSAYTMRADLCLSEGDLPGARAWLDAAARCQQQRGGMAFRASVRLACARVHQAAGDLTAAHAEAEEALAQAQSPREFRALITACRMAGELAARLGRTAEAASRLQAAQELAERCAYPYEVAMTQLVRAEVLPGWSVDLAAARETFARLGATPALARADALLETRATAGAPAGLSARELEVVRLVAQGLTDKEIAGQLFISPRTVDGHLRRIFAKVGVVSRAALATRAAQRGWV